MTERIGPYRLDRELGRGAMGIVYRGFDSAIGRSVAVKIIRPQLSTDGEDAQMKLRFAREAAAAGKLSHPNIVVIYQLGEEGGTQYMAMEFVAGLSLEATLAPGEPMAPEAALAVLSQIADGLDFAHSEGVIHRDIKPANILVRPDGKIKITDFGIARIISQTMTLTGVSFGTPAYMAPEQILAAKVDGKADQFSLAVMAYQMLSGRKPFDADTYPALVFQIMSVDPPPLHSLNSLLPPGCAAAINRALSKEPDRRFATCSAFVEALKQSFVEPKLPPAIANSDPPAAILEWSPGVPAATRRRTQVRRVLISSVVAAAAALGIFAMRANISKVVRLIAVNRTQPAPLPVPGNPQPGIGPKNPETRAPDDSPRKVAPENPVALVAPADKHRRTDLPSGLGYVLVPGGHAILGPDSPDLASKTNLPASDFETRGFWMGETEVTAGAYLRFARATNRPIPSPPRIAGKTFNEDWASADLPMMMVDWNDAAGFCEWEGGRLPGELEWEYAARGGTTGATYGPAEEIGWFADNSGPVAIDATALWEVQTHRIWSRYEQAVVKGGATIHPVAKKKPNAFGLFDLLGSVNEWTASQYRQESDARVVRGGAWGFIGPLCVWQRDRYPPATRNAYTGFRCVIDPQ